MADDGGNSPGAEPATRIPLVFPRRRRQIRRMNRMDFPGGGGEAQIRYLDGDFKVVRPGSYVRCAITNRPILIQDLKYWSVERQEPYLDADAALEAFRRYEGR